MQKTTPFLWLDGQAEEATTFQLAGQHYFALNGGRQFKFIEAVSFFVSCETQEEIDYFRGNLSAGGEEQPCGWHKDKFGLSWQIGPPILGKLLSDEDDTKSQRFLPDMLQMVKLDLQKLKDANAGK